MNTHRLAKLINDPCPRCGGAGQKCRLCKGSGRRLPPDQVEAELRSLVKIALAPTEVELLKACRSVRNRRRQLLGRPSTD